MPSERFAYLFQRYLDKSCSEDERMEFMQAVNDELNGEQLEQLSEVALLNYIVDKQLSAHDSDQIFAFIKEKTINYTEAADSKLNVNNRDVPVNKSYRIAHRVHFLKTAWFRYAAAVLIIAGIGAYLWNNNRKEKPAFAHVSTGEENIQPGVQKATLTLADGSIITLDSAPNGQLAFQGNSAIIKKDGQLIYDSARGSFSPFEKGGSGDEHKVTLRGGFNTMSTPRGGQYQLTLPDGSKVWLNSLTTITYPTIFNKNREISITGEAYFEINPNPASPFIVKTIKDKIEVLGTSFNVNSYTDEPFVKTSLINGSIRINYKTLKPGEAFINNKIIKTNLDHDLAWKNGYFSFEKTSLQSVMRQLSRWYDVDIIYEGNIPERTFSGEIGRSLTLEQVLKGLSKTKINYRIENRQIIIMP
jgi:transmembrane sensor